MLDSENDDIWLKRTEAELEELRARDAKAGRWHDDGGEPILYGPYTGWNGAHGATLFEGCLTLKVTGMRPKWLSYHRRPKGLTAGWCEELQREVLFQRPV